MAFCLVERFPLKPGDEEYESVSKIFNVKNTTKNYRIKIEKIEKVCNDFLMRKFENKKKEYIEKYGHVRVVEVFHGTKRSNISSILKSNLDVKLHGQHVGHRFGAGVSFSAYASYASHYCDKNNSDSMLLCKVIVSNIVEVPESKNNLNVLHEPPVIPHMKPMRYDTTAKNAGLMDVIVKFENDTFYPAYVVSFKRFSHSSPTYDDEMMEHLLANYGFHNFHI